MVTCIDTSGTVWSIISGLNNITGSLYLTFLLITIAILFIAIMFRLSLEWAAIFIIPWNLALVACDSTQLPALGAILFYLGIILSKHFFFK